VTGTRASPLLDTVVNKGDIMHLIGRRSSIVNLM